MYGRIWRFLAGPDSPTRRGLPIAELLAPLPLLALAVLAINDRVLKGSGAPAWLTGKLSDFAGVFVFPLVVTAALDLVLLVFARLGAPVDFTLRRWKLAFSIGFTAIVFAAMKLSPAAAHVVAGVLSRVVGPTHVVADLTDLIALVVLAGTWLHGRRAIARGAHGRLELVQRRQLPNAFADAVTCGADPAKVGRLHEEVSVWLNGGQADRVAAALDPLRR
ncbi:MAG: hypothetical protein JWO36_3190 [Myxococcales bacterium]|nr:hypothetical protein [Myxococcales bacterium]